MQDAEATEGTRAIGLAIDESRAEIEATWLDRVQKDVVKERGVELTQLRDGLPDYLRALVALLRDGELNMDPMGEAAWAKVAREHGITRVQLGFDISQLVHEFVVLRHVIEDVLAKASRKTGCPGRILSDVLDAAIAASVRAYVDARDYGARRSQAEHIGFLTHELRNPLSTAVLATAQVRSRGTPAQSRALDLLERSHQRLAGLIDSVLLSQSLEAGKVESRPVSLSVGQLLDGVLEGTHDAASRKGLEFRVRLDPSAEVCLDPQLTRSAIQNLLDNAVKYTEAGHVELAVEHRSDELSIHVRDSCHGISREELSTIFQPFERGRDRRTGSSGAGLGLAIAQRAILAQGGSIRVESPDDTGCHFWITLPTRRSGSETSQERL